MLNRPPGHDGPSTAPPMPVDGPAATPHAANRPPVSAPRTTPATAGQGGDVDAGEPARPRYALPALCATQIIGWGVLYYAFPVMLPSITRETGWSATSATAAFSAALVISALAGIPVGHLIDRTGPRRVMTAGSLLGVLALAVIATAPTLLMFTVGWLLAGLAMAATFYQPAFTALTRWYGTRRVRALTIVTLAGGLASTIFAPITAVLTEHLGWRQAALTLAAVVLLVAAPLHAAALRGPWPVKPTVSQSGPQSIIASRPFLTLAVTLTLSGIAMYAVVFGLIPLLTERGASTTEAAWALGLGGLGQTLGRLAYAPVAAHTGPRGRTVMLVAAGGLTTALLAAIPGPLWLLTLVAMTAGTVRGNLTLLQATAVTDRWGTRAYGRLTATLAAPVTIAGALAPWAGAALMGPLGGYAHLFWVLAAVSGLAAVAASSDRSANGC